MLDWIDNLPAMVIVTHVIAAIIGACVGLLVAALCVAARGPQYRRPSGLPKYDPASDTDPSHYWGAGR